MNSVLQSIGLSARRGARHHFIDPLSFMRIFSRRITSGIFLSATLFIVSSCHEKTNGQPAPEQSFIKQDSLHKPKVDIKVNRHYDDKGNLIGFDSTYTSYYTNMQGDTIPMDSLMNSFGSYFNRDHPSFFRSEFEKLFFNDSLLYPDFFHRDFFLKRYELNDSYFRDMMTRMDSIKNRFYREHAQRREYNDL